MSVITPLLFLRKSAIACAAFDDRVSEPAPTLSGSIRPKRLFDLAPPRKIQVDLTGIQAVEKHALTLL